jgi:CSLREA domain-containing protein
MGSRFLKSGVAQQLSGTSVVTRKWLILAAIGLIILPSTRLVNAQGLLYFVNTNSDTVVIGACQNGLAGCSLRGAIQTANGHVGADGISIDLPAGSTISLTSALPDLTESVDIIGPGANLMTVRRDTGGSYRIFNVTTTGTVVISGLTVSNGFAPSGGHGGGIANSLPAMSTSLTARLAVTLRFLAEVAAALPTLTAGR